MGGERLPRVHTSTEVDGPELRLLKADFKAFPTKKNFGFVGEGCNVEPVKVLRIEPEIRRLSAPEVGDHVVAREIVSAGKYQDFGDDDPLPCRLAFIGRLHAPF